MLGNPHRLTSVALPTTTADTLSALSDGAANITTVQPWTILLFLPWRCGSTALMAGTLSFTTYTASLPTAQKLVASWIPQIRFHDHTSTQAANRLLWQTWWLWWVQPLQKKQRPPPKLRIFYAHFIQSSIDVWRIFVYLYINFQAPCHAHQLGHYQVDCDADNRRLHARLVSQITTLLMWVWSSATHAFQYSDFFHEIRRKIFTFYNFHILDGFFMKLQYNF
jgi:hypothetical protein